VAAPILDTQRFLETPEGVEIGLRVAGPVPRALAWLLDTLIRGVLYLLAAMTLGFLGEGGMGLLFLFLFLVEWFYPVAGEVLMDGSTPGKRSLGLRVVGDRGTPVSGRASVVRNLLRFVDFLPLLYGFGLVTMLAHRDFKRLGDLAAGTLVVYREEPVAAGAGRREAPPAPPPAPLEPEEQQAVVDFAERLPLLSQERARELALLAGPLTAGAPDPVARLESMAGWLAGRR
jgi:uncharacterized RDD family membrane protein YckC